MKKFLSAILSFAMIFALSIPAFAADITVAPTETVTNEYQSMLELQKISNATLAAEGYTPSEIETIRNTDQIFDDHIALLNTLSDNSLQTAGYTVDQIRGIRNYDPDSATVNEKVALSAECVTTSTIDNYTGTTGRVTSEFEWVGVPAFKMTDILITAWNNWQITGKSANIKYQPYQWNRTFILAISHLSKTRKWHDLLWQRVLCITPPSRTIISTPARDTAFLFSVGSPALTLKLSLV